MNEPCPIALPIDVPEEKVSHQVVYPGWLE